MPVFFKRFFIGLLFLSAAADAQNLPNSTTAPASAVARRVPDYLFIGDTPTVYMRTYTPMKPFQDSSLVNMSNLPQETSINSTYFDVFGRPIQQVIKYGSPQNADIVTPILYDEFNRQSVRYLSYADNTNDGKFKFNVYKKDSTFYKNNFPDESINYSRILYDASPLNITVKNLAPGNSWGGAGIGVVYGNRSNTISDSVVLWTINISTEDDVPVKTAFYLTGTLVVQEVTDERGMKTVQYSNELGQLVLTKTQIASIPGTGHIGWLCTYNIYDEAGTLRFVIPPKATEALNTSTNNWNLATTPAINSDLCYAYFYDSRGRGIMKRIPGKGKSYMAYDLYDRVVLTQDPNLRLTNQWAFVLYDAQNRASKAGFITSALSKDSIIAQAGRSLAYPTLSGTYTITTETYYDNYDWIASIPVTTTSPTTGLTTTNITGTNFYTSYNAYPEYAQAISASQRIRGTITGMKKIILKTSNYIYVVNIYNHKGQVIQTRQNNYSNSIDETTFQYDFTGKVLRSHLVHRKGGTNAQNHTLLTKYEYDHGGRLITLKKNLDGLGDKTIALNTYSGLGQLAAKTIGDDMETQFFSYNVRGWVTGINKYNVESLFYTPLFFSEAISYDYGFTNNQLNGNKAGIKWRMKGDSTVRAFGYSYDNANRITSANYSQQNSGSSLWTKDKADFSVSNLSFDANGNILSMSQRGLQVGSSSLIDSLNYQYFANSNRLQKVDDNATAGGVLGDFKDTTSVGDDYTYDANGNINRDNNRHMHTTSNGPGAVFNALDKADSIVIAGKATTYYYYDASGTMLAKKVNTYTSAGLVVKNYQFLNGFIYLNDTLQSISIEAGRIRYAKKKNHSTGANYYAYEYDFFISDHMGNVRSVTTEGRDTTTYMATMEPARATIEDALFSNRSSSLFAKPHPAFDSDTSNHWVSRLNASGAINKKTGPSLVLKVMAGDKVQINTWAFYNTPAQPAVPGVNLLSDILAILPTSVAGNSGGKLTTGNVPAISSAISPSVTDFLNNDRTYDAARPKAYLNWILFDNQFNFVASNSGVMQVQAGSNKVALVPDEETMNKNGYLYVYVSNESPQDVYFDDITVTHTTGPLMQEQSYYPYGVEMAGISDKAMMKLLTANKFNGGNELEDNDGVNYYNTFFRKYDAQIGRFTGVDILATQFAGLSPYHFGNNNPAICNDPTGAILTSQQLTNIRHNAWTGNGRLFGDPDTDYNAMYGGIDGGGTTDFTGMWTFILEAVSNGVAIGNITTSFGNEQYNFGFSVSQGWGFFDQSGDIYAGGNETVNALSETLANFATSKNNVLKSRFFEMLNGNIQHNIPIGGEDLPATITGASGNISRTNTPFSLAGQKNKEDIIKSNGIPFYRSSFGANFLSETYLISKGKTVDPNHKFADGYFLSKSEYVLFNNTANHGRVQSSKMFSDKATIYNMINTSYGRGERTYYVAPFLSPSGTTLAAGADGGNLPIQYFGIFKVDNFHY